MSKTTESSVRRAPLNPPAARPNCGNLLAQWQQGLQTLSGFRQWKLRLELRPLHAEHLVGKICE